MTKLTCRVGAVLACALFVVPLGCDRRSSPTEPPATGANTHVQGLVADLVRRPLAGATVRVLDGPLVGTTVVSDVSGRFRLSSKEFGTVAFEIALDGFKTLTHRAQWQPTVNGAIDVIRLESLEGSRVPLDPGDYSVTISMDFATARDFGTLPPCAGFPRDLASRTFNATVTTEPHGRFDRLLLLNSPTVFSNWLLGLLIGERFVGFEIEAPLTEELSGFRYLNVMGYAPTDEPAVVSETEITISFGALFQYCELTSPARRGWENCQHVPAEQMVKFHACASNSARMVFTRR